MFMHIARLCRVCPLCCLLAACGDSTASKPSAPAISIAGGETSEFSGDVPLGYCPVIVSRTALDLGSADVSEAVALAAGHHDVALRWKRTVPDERIRGFEEDTRLSVDVTPVAAEELVCNKGHYIYQPGGLEQWPVRKFDLDVALSSEDGAIDTAFRARFDTLDGGLSGQASLPLSQNAGALELGFDASLPLEAPSLKVLLGFRGHSAFGQIVSRVSLPGADTDGEEPYAPITGYFPGPDPGCDEGRSVSLDAQSSALGGTPRAAYAAAVALLPSAPIHAAWFAPSDPSLALGWTLVRLTAGAPERACYHDESVFVYTSLHLESGDGGAAGDIPIVARMFRVLPEDRAGLAVNVSLWGAEGWLPNAEFMTHAVVRDVDLAQAEYAALQLYTEVRDHENLLGELRVLEWQEFASSSADRPILRWCAGSACEEDHWCVGSTPGDGSSCPRPPP